MAKEIHGDSIVFTGVLIKHINDDRAAGQQLQDGVQRTALGQRAKASPPKSPGDERIQQAGLQRTTHEMKLAAVFGELLDARYGCHLEVTKVARQEDQS